MGEFLNKEFNMPRGRREIVGSPKCQTSPTEVKKVGFRKEGGRCGLAAAEME